MREIRTSGLMSGEGKRACANGLRTAPLLNSTNSRPSVRALLIEMALQRQADIYNFNQMRSNSMIWN